MEDSKDEKSSKYRLPAILIGGLVALFFLLKQYAPYSIYVVERSLPLSFIRDKEETYALLASQDKARIREAVRRAVIKYDPSAEDQIVEQILSGNDVQGMNNSLIRSAFDPLWSEAISIKDKRAAFLVASAGLVPEAISQLPQLKDLHPGVILAIASGMNIDNPSDQLRGIPLIRLTELPFPVGEAFKKLSDLGVKNLAERSALALTSIVTHSKEAQAIEAYFGEPTDMREVLAKLSLIAPFFADSEPLADIIYSYLRDAGGLCGQALSWFEIEPAAGWSKVPSSQKLNTLFGTFPKTALSFEQLGDLLMFPLPGVRGEAGKKLVDRFLGKSHEKEVLYLISDENRLTRTQTILLVATFFAKPGTEGEFVTRWFDLQPPPVTVLGVLLMRDKAPANDRFNFEAARYLKRTVWSAPLNALAKLASHPEPLARSMAYARLDPGKPEERAVLQKRLELEKENNLEQELVRRLGRQ